MRLRRFEIQNFKAIQKIELEWNELLVLIGENNCGKSCVLSALSIFLSGGTIRDPLLFHRHLTDETNAIEIVGYFDELTESELQEPAIRARTNNGQWILKKKYWMEADISDLETKSSWKETLYTHSSAEAIIGWPQVDTSWNSFGSEFSQLIARIPDRGAKPNNATRESLRQLIRAERPDMITQGDASWIANPGGGGNWKSNANSLLPRCIFIRAVQEATEESLSKDGSTYGKLINLIIENQLSRRQEITDLQNALTRVLELFSPDPDNPERQAQEIRDLERKINDGLKEVIGGEAKIRTESPDVNALLMPNISLVIRDLNTEIETKVGHQGHGLQRTLVMTLLQLLAEAQDAVGITTAGQRTVVLLVEEPELYMHPQMERRMRDLLYRLASRSRFQVACCTHSPVFIDVAAHHKAIVRMFKDNVGRVSVKQVTGEIFEGNTDAAEAQRLKTVANFNPAVNELFFSNDVVITEEFTAVAAFECAAKVTGLFERHPNKRRGVVMIDAGGKSNIPAFQKVLNTFEIPYRVIHDEDRSNLQALGLNVKIIAAAEDEPTAHPIHLISPEDIEGLLGYRAGSRGKPYAAVCKVEELHSKGALPQAFIAALNFVYFGTLIEPPLSTF